MSGIVEFGQHYEVSNFGRVRSVDRYVNGGHNNKRFCKGQILNLSREKGGYLKVRFKEKQIGRNYRVHILVAKAFIPNPENKLEVNHKDGDKHNNHVDNLEWSTRSENMKHAYDNGLLTGVFSK